MKKLDPCLRAELTKMSNIELQEAFSKNISFGTGGLRAKMGVGTYRLNIYTIRKMTEGYARWINSQNIDQKDRVVVIAYDNRRYSKRFATESANVLAKHHIYAYLFKELKSTPQLSYAVRKLNAFGGIVITASHNPPEYNGFKIYDHYGCQCVLRYTEEIIKFIDSIDNELEISIASEREKKDYIYFVSEDIDKEYYKDVLQLQIHPEIDKNNVKIVFTPQHGTGNIPVREVLKKAGYNVYNRYTYSYPDPDFSNTKNPNPEDSIAFDEAIKVARSMDADCVISTDPDCDRLGVMIKHKEKYIKLTGNQTGAIILKYIIEEKTKKNTIPKNPIVFSTVVTSSLGDLICKKHNITVEKTLTGFKFIGDKNTRY